MQHARHLDICGLDHDTNLLVRLRKEAARGGERATARSERAHAVGGLGFRCTSRTAAATTPSPGFKWPAGSPKSPSWNPVLRRLRGERTAPSASRSDRRQALGSAPCAEIFARWA